MNKVIIVDASDSDCRLMSGSLTRAGYEPVIAEDMEAAKQEVLNTLENMTQNPTVAKPTTELRATSPMPTAEQ